MEKPLIPSLRAVQPPFETPEASRVASLCWADLETQASESLDVSVEKSMLHDDSCGEEEILKPSRNLGRRGKVFALVFVGSCIALGWLLGDCARAESWKGRDSRPATYEHLVKYAAAASSTNSTPSGLLDVFQVYQPVLTPKGVTDETVSANGQENTTAIASPSSSSSCEVLLMEHDFAYSYGLPFVGTYAIGGWNS
jgi:hypothetical protein